jgi:hypothetical protein
MHMGRKIRVNKAKELLTEIEWDFLRDKPTPEHSFEALFLKYNRGGVAKQLWDIHHEVVIAEHVKEFPGTRPKLWWDFSAPRWLDSDHDLPEPRNRLGGIGTPAHEVLNWMPRFLLGIPLDWINASDVDYYGGTMRHVVTGQLVNPKPAGSFTGVAIDEDDPPLYESEAAYLDRHGLFLTGEEKRLKTADFEPVTMEYE